MEDLGGMEACGNKCSSYLCKERVLFPKKKQIKKLDVDFFPNIAISGGFLGREAIL